MVAILSGAARQDGRMGAPEGGGPYHSQSVREGPKHLTKHSTRQEERGMGGFLPEPSNFAHNILPRY
jgi:hypothetical protein